MNMETLFESQIPELRLIKRGKVRDIYEFSDRYILIVATDRLSAFDVILPDPIPMKGAVLTALSNFWFSRTGSIVPNHLYDPRPWQTRPDDGVLARLKGRAILARKAEPIMIEAVVRGYLSGSGWAEYKESGSVCGIKLPAGLTESDKLPEPIFTPAIKAPVGKHDENISQERAENIVGKSLASRIRELSLKLYAQATRYALSRGIIIADTKFEFGVLDGSLVVIDEILTPDSSRFWPLDGFSPGKSQPSFDKQFVRDYLLSINWDKSPPVPNLPPEIIAKTTEKYREALTRLAPGTEDLS
jgi:phosphoribosylaminoimidazole-succinocarboxamide synthase